MFVFLSSRITLRSFFLCSEKQFQLWTLKSAWGCAFARNFWSSFACIFLTYSQITPQCDFTSISGCFVLSLFIWDPFKQTKQKDAPAEIELLFGEQHFPCVMMGTKCWWGSEVLQRVESFQWSTLATGHHGGVLLKQMGSHLNKSSQLIRGTNLSSGPMSDYTFHQILRGVHDNHCYCTSAQQAAIKPAYTSAITDCIWLIQYPLVPSREIQVNGQYCCCLAPVTGVFTSVEH